MTDPVDHTRTTNPDDIKTLDYLKMALDHISGESRLEGITLDLMQAHVEGPMDGTRTTNPDGTDQVLAGIPGPTPGPDGDPGYTSPFTSDGATVNRSTPDEVTEALDMTDAGGPMLHHSRTLAAAVRKLLFVVRMTDPLPVGWNEALTWANTVARAVEATQE